MGRQNYKKREQLQTHGRASRDLANEGQGKLQRREKGRKKRRNGELVTHTCEAVALRAHPPAFPLPHYPFTSLWHSAFPPHPPPCPRFPRRAPYHTAVPAGAAGGGGGGQPAGRGGVRLRSGIRRAGAGDPHVRRGQGGTYGPVCRTQGVVRRLPPLYALGHMSVLRLVSGLDAFVANQWPLHGHDSGRCSCGTAGYSNSFCLPTPSPTFPRHPAPPVFCCIGWHGHRLPGGEGGAAQRGAQRLQRAAVPGGLTSKPPWPSVPLRPLAL